jgi:hypothetical protein
MSPDREETARLRATEEKVARREHELADKSDQDEEQRTHDRRAEKASYLAKKLKQQQRAPDDE